MRKGGREWGRKEGTGRKGQGRTGRKEGAGRKGQEGRGRKEGAGRKGWLEVTFSPHLVRLKLLCERGLGHECHRRPMLVFQHVVLDQVDEDVAAGRRNLGLELSERGLRARWGGG